MSLPKGSYGVFLKRVPSRCFLFGFPFGTNQQGIRHLEKEANEPFGVRSLVACYFVRSSKLYKAMQNLSFRFHFSFGHAQATQRSSNFEAHWQHRISPEMLNMPGLLSVPFDLRGPTRSWTDMSGSHSAQAIPGVGALCHLRHPPPQRLAGAPPEGQASGSCRLDSSGATFGWEIYLPLLTTYGRLIWSCVPFARANVSLCPSSRQAKNGGGGRGGAISILLLSSTGGGGCGGGGYCTTRTFQSTSGNKLDREGARCTFTAHRSPFLAVG